MFKSIATVFSKFFFAVVLLIPGLLIVGYIIYSTIQFEVQTQGFTRAKISYLEANEADTTGKTTIYHLIDAKGNEIAITYNSVSIESNSSATEDGITFYDSESGVSIFEERRVRFDAKNPAKIYFENHWFGIAITIAFGSIFIFAGYVSIFQINIIQKPRRLIIAFIALSILVIGLGLLTDYIFSFDKANEERFKYEYLAAIFILIGGTLLGYWLWTQKMWKELNTIGRTISIKNYNVVLKNKIGSWHTLDKSNEKNSTFEAEVINTINQLPIKIELHADAYDWALINPYVIQCAYIDEHQKKHIFTSEHIWFNPTPFIKGEIKVLVHPKNAKYHKIDTSFLPDVDIITGRIYTRL